MRPKKVLTPEHQKKLIAGRVASTIKRVEVTAYIKAKEESFKILRQINDEIDCQLDVVRDDVVSMHKMLDAMDRAMNAGRWTRVLALASGVQAFSSNIQRRLDVCLAQAQAAARMATAMQVKKKGK